MDQDSSLNNSFDFNTQSGVMLLLSSIRASGLSPADKNDLRDLVFLYTNGGGDASVRIALERKLAATNIKPVAPTKKADPVEPPKPELPFGTYRPAPVFKTPTIVASEPSVAKNNNFVPPPRELKPEVSNTEPVSEVSVSAQSEPQGVAVPPTVPVQVAPIPLDNQIPATQIPIASNPLSSSSAVAQFVPPPVAAQPVKAAAPQSSSTTASSNSNYLDRIREIKTAVNSKVGNPVNLVDINNEVGREYMNALLEAMKRLSGGAAGQIDVAMQRLEAAYQAVEVAVADHDKLQKLEAEVEAEMSPVEPVSAFASSPAPEKKIITEAQPVAVARPIVPPQVVSTPVNPPVSAPVMTQRTVSTSTAIPVPPPVPTFPQSAPVSNTTTVRPIVREVPVASVPPAPVSGFAATAQMPTSAPQAAATSIPQASSLAESPKILTPQDLPSAASLNSSVTGDALHTREIDDGLEQLLSDWVLFNKSGLFGTGPKGREHPLFKKIADLQIPLLLSGRFEGSTQEIKQSITDYMNGWRYEQGIIYEQGETFEHYLRRVIKHILDLQNKRRQA